MNGGDVPNLPVLASGQEVLQVESGELRVTTIGLDTSNNPGALVGIQEGPNLAVRVGEIDEEPVTSDTDNYSEKTLEDKDPSPARKTTSAIEMDEAEGNDTREGRGETADDVEEGITLAHLKSSVPCSEQVDDTREETGLEKTEDDSQSRKTSPVMDQAQTDQDDAPCHCDESQEGTGTEFSAQNSGRRLEQNVSDEEQQCNQRL